VFAKYWWAFLIPVLIVAAMVMLPDRYVIDMRNFSTTLSRAVCEEGVMTKTMKLASAPEAAQLHGDDLPTVSSEDAHEFQGFAGVIMDTSGWTAVRVKGLMGYAKPGFATKLIEMSLEKSDKKCSGIGSAEEREKAIRYLIAAYNQ